MKYFGEFCIPYFGEPLRPPEGCPLTRKLTQTVSEKTKAPIELGLASILSTYSTLLQSIVDVERPEVGVGPVSLYVLGVAQSGERKTAISNYLTHTILKYQEEEVQRYKLNLEIFELEITEYELEVTTIKKEILKSKKTKKPTEELKAQFKSLLESRPKHPKTPQFILEDTSPEAFVRHLHEGVGYASLISSEGGTILNGRGFQNITMLNKAWDGDVLTVNRVKGGSFTINQPRVAISLMAQPKAISKFIQKRGDESKGVGLLARFITCHPESTQGSRFIHKGAVIDESGYQEYMNKVDEILMKLRERRESNVTKRAVMKFDGEASDLWIWIFNYIEEQLLQGGRFHFAQDHGSKLAENIARIAALLTYIELGEDSLITITILRDAARIAFYFSDASLRVFNFLPDEQLAYNALYDWFHTASEGGVRYVRKNKILQSGPALLRDKSLLNDSLGRMVHEGLVSVLVSDKGMHIVDLRPKLAPDEGRLNEDAITRQSTY
jgi:hypothetical protein